MTFVVKENNVTLAEGMYDPLDASEGSNALAFTHIPNAILVVAEVRIEDYSLCLARIRVLVVRQREEFKIVFTRDLIDAIRDKADGDAFRLPVCPRSGSVPHRQHSPRS